MVGTQCSGGGGGVGTIQDFFQREVLRLEGEKESLSVMLVVWATRNTFHIKARSDKILQTTK